jgi:hypothetical protein
MLQLVGFSDEFDAYYLYREGLRRNPAPKPSMKLPATVQQIIDELETTKGCGRSEVICRLLDMSEESRADLERVIDETRRRVRKDGLTHDVTMITPDCRTGVTFFATKPAFADAARDKLPRYMEVKRSQAGATDWIGFLSVVGQKHLLETFVFLWLG